MRAFLFFILVSSFVYGVKHPAQVEKEILGSIKTSFEAGEYEKSWQAWKENEANYRSSVLFLYWGGKVLIYRDAGGTAERDRRYKAAIRLLNQAEKIFALNFRAFPVVKRQYIDTLFHQAMAHYAIGNRRLALGIFEKIVTIDDRNAQAWYNIGAIYHKLDDVIEANRAYRRYLDILNNVEEEF